MNYFIGLLITAFIIIAFLLYKLFSQKTEGPIPKAPITKQKEQMLTLKAQMPIRPYSKSFVKRTKLRYY